MAKVATVRVKDGKGEKVINASDYNEEVHGKVLPEPKPKVEAEPKGE